MSRMNFSLCQAEHEKRFITSGPGWFPMTLLKCIFQGIVRQAIGVLSALAGNDEIKVAIVTAGGVELLLSAMTQHQVCESPVDAVK